MGSPVVAVALSGGVDSLVSGYVLKQKYKNIFGIHFTTGYDPNPINPALLEKQLGFPVHRIDLSEEFENLVVNYFVQTYLDGKTPNPCLICNKKIKFGILLAKAIELGADVLSTGHYATIVNHLSFPDKDSDKSITRPYLEKGKDPLKDQSYFLSLLSPDQLEKIIFPLAGMIKEDVKAIAKKAGISPLHPSESQDICFIRDNNFSKFILDKEKITPKPGEIVNIQGEVIGQHAGLFQFTIGQRRGINCPASEPYYVKQLDMQNNRLVVCFKNDLSSNTLNVSNLNWNHASSGTISGITTKIRYAHKGALSSLDIMGSNGKVRFESPQNAITPGQGAVFYKEDRVLGAGIIQ